MLSTNLLPFASKRHAGRVHLQRLPLLGLFLAMWLAALAGCGENPGNWPKEKLNEHVKQSLIDQGVEVTEVNLSAREGGGYEGTAKVSDGETLKLIVTQDPAAHRLTWDAQGDRGSLLDGYYELK